MSDNSTSPPMPPPAQATDCRRPPSRTYVFSSSSSSSLPDLPSLPAISSSVVGFGVLPRIQVRRKEGFRKFPHDCRKRPKSSNASRHPGPPTTTAPTTKAGRRKKDLLRLPRRVLRPYLSPSYCQPQSLHRQHRVLSGSFVSVGRTSGFRLRTSKTQNPTSFRNLLWGQTRSRAPLQQPIPLTGRPRSKMRRIPCRKLSPISPDGGKTKLRRISFGFEFAPLLASLTPPN